MAVPDVGSSSPHSMRMVVDFPAPLLPRKPKISPRATSKLMSSTATNWPKRRVRRRTTIVAFAGPGVASLSAKGPLQPRFREADVRQGARAIQLRLQPRDLRVQDVGAGGDACLVAFVDHAFGVDRGTDLLVRGGERFAARREVRSTRA